MVASAILPIVRVNCMRRRDCSNHKLQAAKADRKAQHNSACELHYRFHKPHPRKLIDVLKTKVKKL